MEQPGVGPRRILIVEDEPGISFVCLRALAGKGFEVDVAVNGEVALPMLRRGEHALCLIDISTPVMNDTRVYQYVVNNDPELASGVIFTTGDVIAGGTWAFLERTGRPFLARPFTPDELRDVIMEALSEKARG
jgi:DNA-binding NtrC family response regulator